MFPENPFLQLTLPRVNRALLRIGLRIWNEVAPVRCFYGGAGTSPTSWEAARKLKYKPVRLPFHWGRVFDQGWFKLEVPPEHLKKQVYLHWKDQGQGTLYLDGVPYYGFDIAHHHCPLPKNPGEMYVQSLCLQSAIWHPDATGLDSEGSKLTRAALMTRDDLAWSVYHDLRTLYDLTLDEAKANFPTVLPKTWGSGYAPPIDIVSPLYRRLLRAMDDAVIAFDQGELPAIQKSLQGAYKRFRDHGDEIRAVLTGHAHIDLVWLWPERTGEYKAVHTFSTMNRLMDLYPEFIFGYSQPASYDAVERISPRLMKQVKKRIRGGKWEAVGATEVESDTLMACGEALARSFLLGQKSFQRLQGKPSRVLWLPDVFGYCGSLPQIMRQTGVEYFFTTKLTWSNINRFPYSSFIWRGIDGSEVLVHVTQENGYNLIVSPEEIRRGARAYRQSDVHDEYLLPTGYGDGGGGVTEEMCERARRLKSFTGAPAVSWGRIDDFFDRLNKTRAKLPSWQGELYLEYHRGVLTTHGHLKSAFRACERALQTWEAVRCANSGGKLDDHPWRRFVFAQFHDYIPGSSVWEVYEEGVPELDAIGRNALASAAGELGNSGKPALFNPLPVERIHVLEDGARAVRLAPLSGAPLTDLPPLEPAKLVRATSKNIESDSVHGEFDAKGRITRLSFENNDVPISAPLNDLMIFPDFPHGSEAWDIDRQTLAEGHTVDTRATARVSSASGLRGAVEFRRKLGQQSSITVRYSVDAFQPVLHIEYDLDWHEKQTLLKAVFPTSYLGRMVRYGAPFGSVLRGQQPGPPQDEAMFENAGSRWVIVGDDASSSGLGIITEAKYGFSCRDGVLGVSLVRSPHVTGEGYVLSNLVPASIRRGGKRDTHSDQGHHRIRLAVCFHSPHTPRNFLAPTLADTLFTDPIPYRGGAVQAGLLGLEGLESLVPCWAKPAADGKGWILRLHETMGRRGHARLRLEDGKQAFHTDLSETSKGGRIRSDFSVSPYELISLRIC